MCFVISLIPATFWAIVGYFILFSSTRAKGTVQTLGRVLAVWTFIIAGFILLGGAYVTLSGMCSIDGLCSINTGAQ
jgi:hypothetical protein